MKGKLAVGAGILALALGGAPAAMANEPVSGLTQSQQASNNNGTQQDAGASATSKQANVNVPINVLTNESGNGNVAQQNSGETQAGSGNHYQTGQSNGQNQQGSTSSKGCCSGSGGSKQSQQATNNNQTDQHAKSDANTHQANVNVPVNVLTNESGNGDVKQENNATTKANADNENDSWQSNGQNQQGSASSRGCGCGSGGGDPQSQKATNNNDTKQNADAKAGTYQANVNVPVNVLTNESGNGDVHQGNDAYTKSSAGNENQTGQSNRQNQDGSSRSGDGPGGFDQSQEATNNNKTSQEAKTDAGTFQLNVNAPINLLTNESGNGDVTQHNDAKTIAKSENSNDTWQSNRQNQDGSQVSKGQGCGDDHGRDKGHDGLGKDGKDGKVGGEGGFSQSQEATNNNQTDQDADAYANTRQKNVNVPVNFLTNDSGNGDVRQRNDAKTIARSENENQADQSNRQNQRGFSSHKGSCGCRKHHGHKRGEGRHGLIPLWPVAAVEPLPLGGWPLVALGGFLLTGGLTLRRRSV
jgi:hypothetical protein